MPTIKILFIVKFRRLIPEFLLIYLRQLAFLHVHLKTMAYLINASGETGYN